MRRLQDPDLEALLAYLEGQKDFVFLDTSRPDIENVQSLLFVDPVEILTCESGDDQLAYLERLQERIDAGYYLAGWVAYEFGARFEGNVQRSCNGRTKEDGLLARLGVYLSPCRFDHRTGEHDFPLMTGSGLSSEKFEISKISPSMERGEYIGALGKVQEYIRAGDTYQVNYTMKLYFDFYGSREKLYTFLRRNQSVAYGAYIGSGSEQIMSFSPELFFRKDIGRIKVRPMKGTVGKGVDSREERANRDFLRGDGKNRSENVMIVDLLRNDLARLLHRSGESEVYVESLFDVESYESLLQMTSTIIGRQIHPDDGKTQVVDLFRALFPSGSITGAPKIRTMQIIEELEKEARGVYTGGIGYLGPGGEAVFNVPIRTIRLRGQRGEMGIGGGITHDSIPAEEWREALLKGRFLTHGQEAFCLLETMLWCPGHGFYLLESHLRRLEQSADYFKYSFNDRQIRQGLNELASSFDSDCYRVRVSLAKDGRYQFDSTSCGEPENLCLPERPDGETVRRNLPVIKLAEEKVIPIGPWLYHKTTRRQLYDEHHLKAQNAGLYDYLFVNERDEITEGSITNIIVYCAGKYKTPPVSSGLLPGIMRKKLLSDAFPDLQEEVVKVADLKRAEAIFVCNSVRGVVQVRLDLSL